MIRRLAVTPALVLSSTRAGIERLLETSDEARAIVDELQVATSAIKDDLMTSAIGLLPEQRAAIKRHLRHLNTSPRHIWPSAP